MSFPVCNTTDCDRGLAAKQERVVVTAHLDDVMCRRIVLKQEIVIGAEVDGGCPGSEVGQ
jgi:hypothetical protein